MKWQVNLKRSARNELEILPNRIMQQVYDALVKLGDNPLPPQSKKLQGSLGYRLRVGDYRVLYELDKLNQVIAIYAVRHRREAYR